MTDQPLTAFATGHCRSQRPTPSRLRRSRRAAPSVLTTSSGSTLPSSTNKVASPAKPRRTSSRRAKCLRRRRTCRSAASTSSQKSGASGPRWKSGTSAFGSRLACFARTSLTVGDRNYDEAIKVMQRASAIPNKWKSISFHDEVRRAAFSVAASAAIRWRTHADLPSYHNRTVPLRSATPLQIAQALVVLRRPGRVDRHSRDDQGRVRPDL